MGGWMVEGFFFVEVWLAGPGDRRMEGME